MKRSFILLIILALSISLTACNTEQIKGTVISQTDGSTVELDIMPQKLFEFASISDTVIATAGDHILEMVLVDALIAEEGKLQLIYDPDRHGLSICSYGQNFCDNYGIPVGTKVIITPKGS